MSSPKSYSSFQDQDLSSWQQDLAELLTQVVGQEISPAKISHRLVFITALSALLMGVMYADGQVAESEKQQLKSLIGHFIPSSSGIGQLMRSILLNVQQKKIYANRNALSQLTQKLSESEKLLIVGLCYELAAADGDIAAKESQYIEAVSNVLSIDSKYLSRLRGDHQNTNDETLGEVHTLLDPQYFQGLDPAFARAASIIRTKLVKNKVCGTSNKVSPVSYLKLQSFKELNKKLVEIAAKLLSISQDCQKQNILSQAITDEACQLLGKLQSQEFRIVVIGEFSQGKSTLLNALLGIEIQPVRAIPCSGVVTILRYGKQQRVTCRYKDGQEEEISPDQYQEMASISEQAALSNIAEELSKSKIAEIIFEHPSLELCQHQVSIIDSPGLNEHPERTLITQKLLKNADAAIFLANASRLFTQGERELLLNLRSQLRQDSLAQPAENLFVLINFIDLLRREQDKDQVRRSAEAFLQGSTPIISDSRKLHFISAQAALDAILEGEKSEYLDSFREFTVALQDFLTEDKGSLIVRKMVSNVQNLIFEIKTSLHQTETFLEGQVSLSEADQRQILEQIGVVSGREVKLRLIQEEIADEVLDAIGDSWKSWADGIEDRIAEKSAAWTSEAEEKSKIMQDYANQFIQNISSDLDEWLNSSVKSEILSPAIQELDEIIFENLHSIHENLKLIDLASGSSLSQTFDLSLANFGINLCFDSCLDQSLTEEESGLFGNMGVIGGIGIVGGILSAVGIASLPLLAAGAVIGWLLGGNSDEIYSKMKQEVYDKGFEKFCDSLDEVYRKIIDHSVQALNLRFETAIEAMDYSIHILDQLLEKQQSIYQATLESKNAQKRFIQEQYPRLDEIEAQVNSCLKLSTNGKTK